MTSGKQKNISQQEQAKKTYFIITSFMVFSRQVIWHDA